VSVERIVSLGRGVAYGLSSPELSELHANLRSRWVDLLTRQDAQSFRPHVTVQNKVTSEVARATFLRLASGFEAWSVGALGLDLWRYAGGPWVPVRRFAFISPH
jgi:2'-5' RNA ligase